MGQHETSRGQAQLVAQLATIRAKAARARRLAEHIIRDEPGSQRLMVFAAELEEEAASIEEEARAAQAILVGREAERTQKPQN